VKFAIRNPQFDNAEHGSIMVLVLWIAFGMVTLALYFANSMTFELRAADNRVATVEADQAIAGAARYVSNVLANTEHPGMIPPRTTYLAEAVPVGNASFWLIGRNNDETALASTTTTTFALVDESSKLNLNTATRDMLMQLPYMTDAIADAIIDWRDTDSDLSESGAEDEAYGRLSPARLPKNKDFDSVDELSLVYGMDPLLLLGEDFNRNGLLDANENDGEDNEPYDNRDGRLDPGWHEYLTVYTVEPTTGTNVNNRQQMTTLLTEILGQSRANQLVRTLATNNSSVLQFYVTSGMEASEFELIEPYLSASNAPIRGLVNVNTASEAVLACIPGIGTTNASSLIAARQQTTMTNSIAWVKDALDRNSAIQAGRYITGRSYQFTADIAAIGHHGRGYQRVRYVFDTSKGTADTRQVDILSRQELTHFGWALGRQTRQSILLAKESTQ
jgi:type II secretory pathway component PulK